LASAAEIERYNPECGKESTARSNRTRPEQLWHVAIEHRLMHAETFAYMLHNLDPAVRLRRRRACPD
jgi:hypothetical protein